MTPNLPINALAAFGPEPLANTGWGGVPWKDGVLHPEPLQGMAHGSVTTFPYAPGRAVMAITDSDNDLDGPGGSRKVDPCWQGQTSLRYPDQSSCDSRKFPGVVISSALKALGIRLGDFCLCTWNGAIRSAQVYDIGPTRKAGENSIYLNRQLGVVLPIHDDHYAAEVGHDAQDVVTLFFAGSGPGHALPVDEIVERTHALWNQFTARPAAGSIAVAKTAPRTAPGGTAAGSVGLAVPLALSGGVCVASTLGWVMHVVGEAPQIPPGISAWLACLSFLLGLVLLCLHIRKELRPNPSLDEQFVPRTELDLRFNAMNDKITALQNDSQQRHDENVERLGSLDEKLDRNCEEIGREHEALRKDVRHDFKQEVTALDAKSELRYERTIDRITELMRGLSRAEGRMENTGGSRG